MPDIEGKASSYEFAPKIGSNASTTYMRNAMGIAEMERQWKR
jgi:hypothetical protein